jgi:hypothetical protein
MRAYVFRRYFTVKVTNFKNTTEKKPDTYGDKMTHFCTYHHKCPIRFQHFLNVRVLTRNQCAIFFSMPLTKSEI